MYKRSLQNQISKSVSHIPAIVILGPRQIGKTTLALEVTRNLPTVYLDLENPDDLQTLESPAHYLNLHADKLVVIDEVQRYPDLFMSLRGIIDARRREGRGNGRFLIIGSAYRKLLGQTSESLAGRVSYRELRGLNPFEIEEPQGEHLQRLWTRGGFPNSYGASDDADSYKWRQNLIRSYVECDIPQMGPRIRAGTLRRFLTLLAHSQGELLNASMLAASLGVSSVTVSRYLDMMEDLMLVRKLEPVYARTGKRLVKSARTYIRDSGLLHTLLRIPDHEALLGHPILARSWEGFVIENILSILPSNVRPGFYRTSAGAQIDLLLEFDLNEFWAISINFSTNPRVRRGFLSACEELKVKRKFVVYPGEDTRPLPRDISVLSLASFMEELRSQFS